MDGAFSRTLAVDTPAAACDLLARMTGLPKTRVKDCMVKGGVWWTRPGRRTTRLRRATAEVRPGDGLEINYDPTLLALQPPLVELIDNAGPYSVWNKPPGVLAQGTRFADHCALPRLAQARLKAGSEPHPVHRLDREARGLILLAHDRRAAARLGELFRQGLVHKEYALIVRGIPDWDEMDADRPLDGRPCRSRFAVLERDPDSGMALLDARIETGRRHQIRRHLADLGFPVLGDPRYGKNNACAQGLQLLARTLALTCPFTGQDRSWNLPLLPFPLPESRDGSQTVPSGMNQGISSGKPASVHPTTPPSRM